MRPSPTTPNFRTMSPAALELWKEDERAKVYRCPQSAECIKLMVVLPDICMACNQIMSRLRIKCFSLESWIDLKRKMRKHFESWVNLNQCLDNPLESWTDSESMSGKPLESWVKSIQVFEMLLESWADRNKGTWVKCLKKGHTNATLEWKAKKRARKFSEKKKQKRSTKWTVYSNRWVMTWFESIF